MQGIKLPPAVFEEHLPKFLGAIWQVPDDHDLEIDFSRGRFYIPIAITSLIARIDYAASNGGKIRLCGLNKCENLRYLQRIDFFNQLKVELDEDFMRHDPQDAFVPVREVPIGSVSIRNDEIATELARCLTRGKEDDLFQLAQYSLGEVIANVKQHAERSGFVCAQSFKKHEMSRLGIADCGIGLRESFRRTDTPRFRDTMNDLQVLELAMSAYGSSKAHLRNAPYGETANKGVGLTMIRFMVAESYGHFFLSSGKAWWYRDGLRPDISGTFPGEGSVQGTVVGVAFQRSQVDDYLKLRRLAWDSLGLTDKAADTKLFT